MSAINNFKDSQVAAVTGNYISLPDGSLEEKIGDISYLFHFYKKHFYKNMTNTNSIIRKDLWEQYCFDERLAECEDYDWGIEMLSRG